MGQRLLTAYIYIYPGSWTCPQQGNAVPPK